MDNSFFNQCLLLRQLGIEPYTCRGFPHSVFLGDLGEVRDLFVQSAIRLPIGAQPAAPCPYGSGNSFVPVYYTTFSRLSQVLIFFEKVLDFFGGL